MCYVQTAQLPEVNHFMVAECFWFSGSADLGPLHPILIGIFLCYNCTIPYQLGSLICLPLQPKLNAWRADDTSQKIAPRLQAVSKVVASLGNLDLLYIQDGHLLQTL